MTGHMVNADRVRDHVRLLVAEGMTQAAIVRKSGVSGAAVSALLHGQFAPGRPQQETMQALTADALLAVEFELPEPKPGAEPLCAPGERFVPVGYRVGRCADCGQLAGIRIRPFPSRLVAHPRGSGTATSTPMPNPETATCVKPGTQAGYQQHRRDKTDPCAPCTAYKRGYDRGLDARPSHATAQMPAELTGALLRLCRAIVLGRPMPRIREMAAEALRVAVAEERPPAELPTRSAA